MSYKRSRTSFSEEVSRVVFSLLCIAVTGWVYVHVILPQQQAQIKTLSAPHAGTAPSH